MGCRDKPGNDERKVSFAALFLVVDLGLEHADLDRGLGLFRLGLADFLAAAFLTLGHVVSPQGRASTRLMFV